MYLFSFSINNISNKKINFICLRFFKYVSLYFYIYMNCFELYISLNLKLVKIDFINNFF